MVKQNFSFDSLFSLLDLSEALYPSANSAQEGSFGVFKANQERFVAMTAANLRGMTMCSVNNTMQWIDEMNEPEQIEILIAAKAGRKKATEDAHDANAALIEKTLAGLQPFEEPSE